MSSALGGGVGRRPYSSDGDFVDALWLNRCAVAVSHTFRRQMRFSEAVQALQMPEKGAAAKKVKNNRASGL